MWLGYYHIRCTLPCYMCICPRLPLESSPERQPWKKEHDRQVKQERNESQHRALYVSFLPASGDSFILFCSCSGQWRQMSRSYLFIKPLVFQGLLCPGVLSVLHSPEEHGTQQTTWMSSNSSVVTACSHEVAVARMARPSKEMFQLKPGWREGSCFPLGGDQSILGRGRSGCRGWHEAVLECCGWDRGCCGWSLVRAGGEARKSTWDVWGLVDHRRCLDFYS